MKRILPLALICVTLVVSLAPPAAAAEVEWTNVLDYTTVDGDNNWQAPTDSYETTVIFATGTAIHRTYADLLITCSTTLTNVNVDGNELTVVKLGTNTYRAYGKVPYKTSIKVTVTFTASGLGAYYTINSFRLTGRSTAYAETGFLAVGTSNWSSSYVYMSASDSPAKVTIQDTYGYPVMYDFVSYIYPSNWAKYDSIDMYIQVCGRAVSSITAQHNGANIPLTISYLNLNSGEWLLYDVTSGNDFDTYLADLDKVDIMVSLDLSNIDRTVTNYPQVTIRGTYQDDNVNQYVQLTSVVGFVEHRGTSLFSYWMMKLGSKLDSIVSALVGDTSSGDQFKDDSAGLISGLDDISASMASVERPSMDSIDADFSSDIGSATTLVQSLFGIVTDVSWISRAMLASAVMGLIAYILYGKE